MSIQSSEPLCHHPKFSIVVKLLTRFGVNSMVIFLTIAVATFSVIITSTALILFQGYVDVLGICISIAAPVIILPVPARIFLSMFSRLHAIEDELRAKNRALHESLQEIKILSGLLPICCNCKKIRDDQGYWNEIEQYFDAHSDLKLTHGYCPECVKKLYPELYPELSPKTKIPERE